MITSPCGLVLLLEHVERTRCQIGLTADTYAHVLPSLKSDASDRIGELLWGEEAG